jgi:hypothetical protein
MNGAQPRLAEIVDSTNREQTIDLAQALIRIPSEDDYFSIHGGVGVAVGVIVNDAVAVGVSAEVDVGVAVGTPWQGIVPESSTGPPPTLKYWKVADVGPSWSCNAPKGLGTESSMPKASRGSVLVNA